MLKAYLQILRGY